MQGTVGRSQVASRASFVACSRRCPVRCSQANSQGTQPTRMHLLSRSSLLRQGLGLGLLLLGSSHTGVAAAEAAVLPAGHSGSTLVMTTVADGSSLSIGRYPDFGYSPRNGGGNCTVVREGSRLLADFDVAHLKIPDVDSRTATFLGAPLPGVFRIAITPHTFKGWIDQDTGEAAFDFFADFLFTAGGSLYKAPPLRVLTRLTTESVQGRVLSGQGQRIDAEGRGRLVGVASLEPTGDRMLDLLLGLPTDCRASMGAEFRIA